MFPGYMWVIRPRVWLVSLPVFSAPFLEAGCREYHREDIIILQQVIQLPSESVMISGFTFLWFFFSCCSCYCYHCDFNLMYKVKFTRLFSSCRMIIINPCKISLDRITFPHPLYSAAPPLVCLALYPAFSLSQGFSAFTLMTF